MLLIVTLLICLSATKEGKKMAHTKESVSPKTQMMKKLLLLANSTAT